MRERITYHARTKINNCEDADNNEYSDSSIEGENNNIFASKYVMTHLVNLVL